METPAHLTVDLGRLDNGRTETLKGELDSTLLEIGDLEQISPAGPLRYDLFCELFGNELLVRGKLALPCNCVCSRCGCDYRTEFIESGYCESFEIEGIDMLDLTESLREGIILALPSYPICKEDCKGVCLRCGQDLNQGPCRCVSEEETSPWDALDGFAPKA